MAVPAFVLHSRPYRETSALLELLTPGGRVAAVLRNARTGQGALARPFVLLDLETRGRNELKSVIRLESGGLPFWLEGAFLYSGLYLNELLVRLLPVEDPHPVLFGHYARTLALLARGEALEPALRAFEWQLLGELGYGFSLTRDTAGQPLAADACYRFWPEAGLERAEHGSPALFSGASLLALARADWLWPGVLGTAKQLMRQALAPHLGPKPLVSRSFFVNLRESCCE